ncbi:phosphatidylglycerophosphatase A family protein [Candidatus Blochmannia ocreatus (nom. nud.)]|uniref:Phosphatidylglycerophosphatase A n=1 Tax=Candidatus Blochmannia ocreatus (nom. nud.) TaxID=251538 RepID=A0ABY4STK5_9ENTR|nr:phosphatidylglycerophosphatase A [Candidatus Blochmannia ocreatus]URJ25304.1 phosphatidylglycerophosphatase A [Candidatus Blochmannia ocreatus]
MLRDLLNTKKFTKTCYLCATGFGIGTIPKTPTGSIASLFAIPIWWILVKLFSYKFYFCFLTIGIIIGTYFCNQTNKIIGIHDHKSIVLDEFLGMWITLIIVPTNNWYYIMFAFTLFRILDITKPWPISWCDRTIKGGFGIIFDDIVAGVISVFLIILFRHFT